MPSVALSPEVVSALKPAKIFRHHNEQGTVFTSVDFDDKGEHLLTSCQDETLQLFSCRSGKHVKQLHSRKYGVNLARFTHSSTSAIYASTKDDDTIRYLSLHDNSFICYFKGHKRKVSSLAMCPVDDTFLSGAEDDTVRLWDLRAERSQGLLNVATNPCVAFDRSGMVFAVALNLRSTVLLYDLKNFDKAPFLTAHLNDPVARPGPRQPTYTSLKFSNDGAHLLLGTSGDVHYVLDGYNGSIVARLEGHVALDTVADAASSKTGGSGQEVCWSPDGRYVIGGSADGKICVWDLKSPNPAVPAYGDTSNIRTLHPFKAFQGHNSSASRVVGFNPRLAMFASAGPELAFWLPDPREYPPQTERP